MWRTALRKLPHSPNKHAEEDGKRRQLRGFVRFIRPLRSPEKCGILSL